MNTTSWVASSGKMRWIAPAARQASTASGSTQAFHSPVSVVFPRSSSVPPIQITSRVAPARSVPCWTAAARFVNGPSATIDISPGWRLTWAPM